MDNIYIASDHAGFDLKNELREFLSTLGHNVIDKGPFKLDPLDDYPDCISPVALEIAKDPMARGIVIGGTGQGEAIVCNRFKGVRAVVFYGDHVSKGDKVTENVIRMSREHNDSNILSLGARVLNSNEAKIAVNLWLGTKFSGDERHVRRIKKLDELV
jgi:ribose 5-phosphate isomerase B